MNKFLNRCAFCRELLTEDDVASERHQAAQKKQDPPEPDDFCCRRKDCRKARRQKQKTKDEVDQDGIDIQDENTDISEGSESIRGEVATRSIDGRARVEAPRVDAIALTEAELAEESHLAYIRHTHNIPIERTSQEIARDLRERLIPREPTRTCKAHNRESCPDCFQPENSIAAAKERLAKVDREAAERDEAYQRGKIIQAKVFGKIEIAEQLQNEFTPKTKTELEKIVDEVARRLAPNPKKPNTTITKSRARLKNTFDKVKNLRRELGYTTREIADVLDHKEFNRPIRVRDFEFGYRDKDMKRWLGQIEEGKGKSIYRQLAKAGVTAGDIYRTEVIDGVAITITVKAMAAEDKAEMNSLGSECVRPGCMSEWKNMLPLKLVSVLTPEEAAFYRDFANRNRTPAEMKAKHGDISDEQVVVLENKIVRHGLHLRLLNPPFGVRSHSFEGDLDEDWQLEIKAIASGHFSSIGASCGHTSGERNVDGSLRGLRKFRVGPGVRRPTGENSTSDDDIDSDREEGL